MLNHTLEECKAIAKELIDLFADKNMSYLDASVVLYIARNSLDENSKIISSQPDS